MSVVPMKLLTIAGPLERFDDVSSFIEFVAEDFTLVVAHDVGGA